jgi:hypothetical protein
VAEKVEAKPEGPIDTLTADASSNTFTFSGIGVRGSQYGTSEEDLSPDVLLPDVLKATQPEMKLVVMLRNPVNRSLSNTTLVSLLLNPHTWSRAFVTMMRSAAAMPCIYKLLACSACAHPVLPDTTIHREWFLIYRSIA